MKVINYEDYPDQKPILMNKWYKANPGTRSRAQNAFTFFKQCLRRYEFNLNPETNEYEIIDYPFALGHLSIDETGNLIASGTLPNSRSYAINFLYKSDSYPSTLQYIGIFESPEAARKTIHYVQRQEILMQVDELETKLGKLKEKLKDSQYADASIC